MDDRHNKLIRRVRTAQVHAGEQEVLKHLREIEGRPEPEPKTFADGWRECRETAAAELEGYAAASENPRIERDFARSFAAAIRKLEPPNPGQPEGE